MAQPVCFVISPIGKLDSPIRQAADDLFELIIEPALEPFGFDVVRADKIPGAGVITNEIISLLQSAELCIIDLSELNPNVFYECGRRHETARPYIQLSSKEDLPFDLAGIRTIHYDLSTPRKVHEAIQEIRRYVDEYRKTGFSTGSSGGSLSSLATALERMELKLDRAFSSSSRLSLADNTSNDASLGLQHPRTVFSDAIASGRADVAANILPRLREVMGSSDYVWQAAGIVARAGYEIGVSVALDLLNEGEEHQFEVVSLLISSLITFYSAADREGEGLERLKPFIEKYLDSIDSGEDKALLSNQLQKLYFGIGDLAEAARWAELATSLAPEEVAYSYNLSMVYEGTGQFEKAAEATDRYMRIPRAHEDSDYVAQAIEVYVKAGRPDDARKLFSELRHLSPGRAAMLTRDEAIRAVVT
jgi:pentatricopeptide repeat protein